MAKKVKAKKVNKPMNPKVKETLKNIGLGLFSNDRAIEGAKTSPWWVGIIIGILAIIFPVIPNTVTYAKQYGSSFLNTYSYNMDVVMTSLVKDARDNNFVIEVKDGETVIKDNNGVSLMENYEQWDYYTVVTEDETETYTWYNSDKTKDDLAIATYTSTVEGVSKMVMKMYYLNSDSSSVLSELKNLLDKNDIYDAKASTPTLVTPKEVSDASETEDTEDDITTYNSSYIIITKNSIYIRIFNDASTSEIGSYAGRNWVNYSSDKTLFERLLTVDESITDQTLTNVNYTDAVFNNWKTVLDESYLTLRKQITINYSFIFLGIYAILTVFMGLMVFLLTRGKSNPFNYLTFWTCFEITLWSALAPGLLSLVLGFMLSSYSMILYIVLLGLRVMWMSMKQLKPQM